MTRPDREAATPLFVAGLALVVVQTATIWLSLGSNPSPTWDDAHFLGSAWRFWNTVHDSGWSDAITGFRSAKPWFFEIVYFPLIAAGIRDTRWFLLVPIAASWLTFACVYATGRRLAPPVLALASALSTVAAFHMGSFIMATQAEIVMSLGVAAGLLAVVVREKTWRAAVLLSISWVLLMAGKQSSIIYVAGLAALFGTVSPLSLRSRITAIAAAAAGASVYVIPVYALNFTSFLEYARFAAGLEGVPFTTFLVQLARGSLGYPVVAAVATGVVAAWRIRSHASVRQTRVAICLLASWLVAFGAVLPHNVVRYITPAIPLIALLPCFLASGSEARLQRSSRTLGWIAVSLGVLSLACAQASIHTNWRTPGFYGGRPWLSSGDFCQASVREWLTRIASKDPARKLVIWLAGDHQYLNTHTIRWQLEMMGVRHHEVVLLADPAADYERLAAGDRPSLLIVTSFGTGIINLTPEEPLRALEGIVASDSRWQGMGVCPRTTGAAQAFVSR